MIANFTPPPPPISVQKHLSEIRRLWNDVTGEALRVEGTATDAPVYAFGSKQACEMLVVEMKMGRAAYNQKLDTWFYVTR